ncbi:MAG TPA: hypothetical protein VL484_09820 [Vicinamibacterales bacterium]|jgi:hypothetical protein|nr:hypothetical protein [Vicinamibacterales bacterium]
MTRFAALPLALFLLLPAEPAAAQSQPAPQQPTAPAQSAPDTREQLERLLEQYGPALPRVLKLDPTLLTNDAYLQPYPALRDFIAQHPDIQRNASYYFAHYQTGLNSDYDTRLPQDRAYEMWDRVMEGFMVAFFFSACFGGVIWLIRTAIQHRKWIRLSKVQTDVHTKLMDRFAGNDELLAYIQTPAGRRFLESAPIPLDSPRAISAPVGRILWSLQIGAVLTVAGAGIEVVAGRAIAEVAQPVAAIGVFVIAIGVGFLLSSALAYGVSRRLGLLTPPDEAVSEIRG